MSIGGTYQHRRYTAATWTSNNYTLLPGELAFETDTGLAKVNLNSVDTAWNSLAYWGGGGGSPTAPSLNFSISTNSQYLALL